MKKILALGTILLLLPLSNVFAGQCRADCNCDTKVNLPDLVIMKQEFFSSGCDLCYPPDPVPKTGQTSCYDINGNIIDCAGTGQDGEYQKGFIRFQDNGDGTITDNYTGLMWTKYIDEIPELKNWPNALTACNDFNFADYADWRLPNYNEIRSTYIATADYIASPFNYHGTPTSDFWTSTTLEPEPTKALTSVGTVVLKTETYHAWCVRGGN